MEHSTLKLKPGVVAVEAGGGSAATIGSAIRLEIPEGMMRLTCTECGCSMIGQPGDKRCCICAIEEATKRSRGMLPNAAGERQPPANKEKP